MKSSQGPNTSRKFCYDSPIKKLRSPKEFMCNKLTAHKSLSKLIKKENNISPKKTNKKLEIDCSQSISPLKQAKCSDFSESPPRFPPINVARYNFERNSMSYKNLGAYCTQSPFVPSSNKSDLSVFTKNLNEAINKNIEKALAKANSAPKTPSILNEVYKCEKEIKHCIFKVNQILPENEKVLHPNRVNEYGIAGKQVLYLTLLFNGNPNPCILKIRQNDRSPDSDSLVYISYTNRRPDDENNDGVFNTSKIKIYTRDTLNYGENFSSVCRPIGVKPPPSQAFLAVMCMNPSMCSFVYYFENEKPVLFDSDKRPVSPKRPQVKLRDLIPLNDSIESINQNQFGTNLKRKEKIDKCIDYLVSRPIKLK